MNIKKILCFSLLNLFGFVFAQELKITHMEGTYDLDGDGLKEFVSIESSTFGSKNLSVVRYYEIDNDGYQKMLWELKAPDGQLGNFVDVELGDLDGDGMPELITTANLAESNQDELLQPVLFYYRWDGLGFSKDPGSILNLSGGRNFIRANNFVLFDYDGDMNQEIAVSLGSPLREIVILDLNDNEEWMLSQTLKPNGMSSGIGALYVSSVDWNKDGFEEIVILSPEGEFLRVQPFYNISSDLISGLSETIQIPGLGSLIPTRMSLLDWNKDNFIDIILPFMDGNLISITLFNDFMDIEKIPIEGGPLSDVRIADFNQDAYDDMLLISGDMNVLTLAYGSESGINQPTDYFTLEDVGLTTAQVFTALPIIDQGIYSGSIIAAGWDGLRTTIFLTDLGFGPEPIKPEITIVEKNIEETIESFPDIIQEEITLPQIPKPLETMGQPLPDGILPKHVLTVDQSFAYTIPEEEKNEFYSFRWLSPPPKGMFFHYDSQSIRWVPNENQLGAYKIAYHIERKIGEDIFPTTAKSDSMLTYKMIPNLEGEEERLWIYVNDPPIIMSQPMNTEFVAGDTFIYKPILSDRNPDAKLNFQLENKPLGMKINEYGTIIWQTDSSHIDIYEVRFVASDGFDRVTQNFNLFARAGIKIISEAPQNAQVDNEYRYKVDIWRPDLEHILTFGLDYAPDGMAIDKSGIINWNPMPTQIDTQKFRVRVNHGIAVDTQTVSIFVNHPPIIRSAPMKMNVISLGEEYRFQPDIIDPNKNDNIIYSALEMPEGMRMDPYSGMIVWEPTRENIDFSNLKIEINDGKISAFIEAEYYVNAPINIVSIPPLQATTGKGYEYDVMVSDMNEGALLPFDNVIALNRAENFRIYSIQISDDVYKENIDRYIMDWNNSETVYLSDNEDNDSLSLEVSRLNLKKYVDNIFWEDDRLNIIVESVDDRTIAIKDILWEFFQGNKGRPPRVTAKKMGPYKYTLVDFPDGMEIDDFTGNISWTPTLDQVDNQKVTYIVSDGYTKDEQSFDVYVNHEPVIISSPPVSAMVGQIFKYDVQVEDKNRDSDLLFSLTKAPQGMQMSKNGKVVWIPKSSQINENQFTFEVSDGYNSDIQNGKVFVNINPSIISTPRPVALTGHEYKYRVVAEDLNSDKVAYRAVKLPKYSTFSRKTGMLMWKPRPNQRGPNDIIVVAVDERGAITSHEFQIHVFEDPSARQMINTGWPLLLSFVGIMFAWGMAQI